MDADWKIKIGPIYFDWSRTKELRHEDGRRLDGYIRFGPSVILTDEDIGEQREVNVLWHEVVHGISDMYGADLNEKQTEVLANGIMDVVRHNPWLLAKTLGYNTDKLRNSMKGDSND